MAVQKQKLQKGKKSWRQIVAPKMFNEMALGETLGYTPEEMLGKRVVYNLMNLTKDVKRQNIVITFEVTGIQDGKGTTSVIAYTMVPSSVKRLVRRRSDRVDISFACETADGRIVRIKPLLVTRGNTTSVLLRKLHHYAADYALKAVKRISYEQLLNDLVSYKFQAEMRQKLAKIFPLKSCEIRSLVLGDAAEKVRRIELQPEPANREPQQEQAPEQPQGQQATQESA